MKWHLGYLFFVMKHVLLNHYCIEIAEPALPLIGILFHLHTTDHSIFIWRTFVYWQWWIQQGGKKIHSLWSLQLEDVSWSRMLLEHGGDTHAVLPVFLTDEIELIHSSVYLR